MGKTLLAIFVFIILTIVIAFALSNFLNPKEKIRYNDCVLMQSKDTKKIDCFGCANGICKDTTEDWIIYENQAIGIPYSCFKSEKGCELAQ